MNTTRVIPRVLALGLILAIATGCVDENERDCIPDPFYAPTIAPADFVATVDASHFPLIPGSTWSYEGGGETIEVEVLTETKQILGVICTVVHDAVFEGGELIEDTRDWYAQDVRGNVWYMGEDSREMEGGEVVSTAGSWEAGVDGAYPGYIMLADPVPGLIYRQEYYVCEAEDMAEIVSMGNTVTVPAGTFQDCIKVHEWNALVPDSDETKFFCPGVGLVLEIDQNGGRVELVDFHIPF